MSSWLALCAGSYLLFILVATIGMRLDVSALLRTPGLVMVAFVWILVHGSILFWVSFLCRSPFFFMVRPRSPSALCALMFFSAYDPLTRCEMRAC